MLLSFFELLIKKKSFITFSNFILIHFSTGIAIPGCLFIARLVFYALYLYFLFIAVFLLTPFFLFNIVTSQMGFFFLVNINP